MSQDIVLASTEREEQYQEIFPQIKALVEGEKNLIANLANISAVLHTHFHWFWIGFYLREEKELVLGPFQGPVACTRIAMGKGVCGTSAAKKETIIVPDVEKFPGHIACSALSKSEIVVPLVVKAETVLVLDIDSKELDTFNKTDQVFLERVLSLLRIHFA